MMYAFHRWMRISCLRLFECINAVPICGKRKICFLQDILTHSKNFHFLAECGPERAPVFMMNIIDLMYYCQDPIPETITQAWFWDLNFSRPIFSGVLLSKLINVLSRDFVGLSVQGSGRMFIVLWKSSTLTSIILVGLTIDVHSHSIPPLWANLLFSRTWTKPTVEPVN